MKVRLTWLVVLLFAVMITVACIPQLATLAYARANILDYINTGPNEFEPSGWNVNGTAIKLAIDVLGWNETTMLCNVGIGDNSVAYLNNTSIWDSDFTPKDMIGADVSTVPYIPEAGPTESTDNKSTNSTENQTVARDVTGKDFYNSTYAAYHPISFGKPFPDLINENPKAVQGTTYCRLVGLQTPSGDLINVAFRTTGYGY